MNILQNVTNFHSFTTFNVKTSHIDLTLEYFDGMGAMWSAKSKRIIWNCNYSFYIRCVQKSDCLLIIIHEGDLIIAGEGQHITCKTYARR